MCRQDNDLLGSESERERERRTRVGQCPRQEQVNDEGAMIEKEKNRADFDLGQRMSCLLFRCRFLFFFFFFIIFILHEFAIQVSIMKSGCRFE